MVLGVRKALDGQQLALAMLRAECGALRLGALAQVGYIWVHEAARELTDDLPIEVARTLRRELVDHAASAFSAFNEGVVTHPPRCKVRYIVVAQTATSLLQAVG